MWWPLGTASELLARESELGCLGLVRCTLGTALSPDGFLLKLQ